MNLANEQPFSHKSNAGQVGSKWGDVLPRKALLASSHTALGCAFQFPLFRHLTRAVKEWEAWGRKQCWTQKLGKGTWCLTGGQSHPWYAPKHYKMLSCEQADIQLMKNGVFCLFPGSSELQYFSGSEWTMAQKDITTLRPERSQWLCHPNSDARWPCRSLP